LIYGTQFSAAAPLRLLAPGVVLMGVVTLGVSLLVSRENPRRVVLLTAVVAVLNIALNLVLIPLYGVIGAASAMLVTEVIYAAWVLRRAERVVGGLRLRTTLVGALTAALAMTAVSLPLRDSLLAGLLVGGGVYLMVLVAIERVMSPRDVRFALSMIRRRLPRGAT
jgi:O-antigen/teichoic acid export membrane protein